MDIKKDSHAKCVERKTTAQTLKEQCCPREMWPIQKGAQSCGKLAARASMGAHKLFDDDGDTGTNPAGL